MDNMRTFEDNTTFDSKLDILANSIHYTYAENVDNKIAILARAIIDKKITPSDLDIYNIENEFELLCLRKDIYYPEFDNAYDFASYLGENI